METLDIYDRLEIRCPRLGHEVTFAYCRREGGDLPCTRSLTCWGGRFPVAAVLAAFLGPQDWERYRERKDRDRDKVTTLLELLAAAQRRRGSGGDKDPHG